MKLKYMTWTGVCLTLLALACAENSKFKGSVTQASAPSTQDAKGLPEPTTPADPLPLSIDAVLPIHEIRTGQKTLQATAVVTGATNPRVLWRVEGPAGLDLGNVDANGVYTSPAQAAAEFEVQIIASLEEAPSVQDSEPLKVIPEEQIFIGCTRGTESFPIVSDVYTLPTSTERLPDFGAIAASKITTVCMDSFNVPSRNFNDGFPGVPNVSEWFALHGVAKLVAPVSGLYSFRLNSDDGSILTLDGKIVVNNDGNHAPKAVDGSVELTAGAHDLVLDYFQGPADEIALELFWKLPGAAEFVIVPRSAFQRSAP